MVTFFQAKSSTLIDTNLRPLNLFLIIVLISLSHIMSVSMFSGDDMPASVREPAWLSDYTVKIQQLSP